MSDFIERLASADSQDSGGRQAKFRVNTYLYLCVAGGIVWA